MKGNKLVDEIVKLVGEDWIVIQREVCDGVREFKERKSCLKFGEAVGVVCCLKRLQECKERMMNMMMLSEVAQGQRLWDLVREVKEKAEMEVYNKEEGKVHKEVTKRRVSESDRFSRRLLNRDDLFRFPSGRFL